MRDRDKPTEVNVRFRAAGRLQIDIGTESDSYTDEALGEIIYDGPIESPTETKPAMLIRLLNDDCPKVRCELEISVEDALELARTILREVG
jgi:hypothetical protein